MSFDLLARIQEQLSESVETLREAGGRLDNLRKIVSPGSPLEVKCWEIVGCDSDLRQNCPAYQSGDGWCFFHHDAGSGPSGGRSGEEQRRCYDCPAREAVVERGFADSMGQEE
jgi:hypothetical protein